MRQSSRISRRYAAALFHTAQREGLAEAVAADLQEVQNLLDEHPQVLRSLTMPRVPYERKKSVLRLLLRGSVRQDLTLRFLDMVVDHGREAFLPESADAFALLMDEARNEVAAEVRSAAPLDEDQTRRLKARLDTLTGRNTRLAVTTDPTLMGGLVVQIGDTVLDGSVQGYLEQFETRLRNAPLAAIRLDDIPTA